MTTSPDQYGTDVGDPDTGLPRLLQRQCVTCVIRTADQGGIDLAPGQREQFLADTLDNDSFVVCHQTLDNPEAPPAICRGFFDQFGDQSTPCQVIRRLIPDLSMIEVPVPRNRRTKAP